MKEIPAITAEKAPDGCKILTTTAEGGATFNRYSTRSFPYYSILKDNHHLTNLITLHQQHESNIVKVHSQNYLAADGASADGLFTNEMGMGLGIITADCYPVVIVGKNSAAALHCGWRSTVKGIIKNVPKFFSSAMDKPFYAYIGPGISKNNYEVQNDFIDEVLKFMNPEKYLDRVGNKTYFNLIQLIKDQLKEIGVENIESADICTYEDNRFYSYRRNPKESGRMLTLYYRN